MNDYDVYYYVDGEYDYLFTMEAKDMKNALLTLQEREEGTERWNAEYKEKGDEKQKLLVLLENENNSVSQKGIELFYNINLAAGNLSNPIENSTKIKYLKLSSITFEEKLSLIEAYHDSYYNTDQDTEIFAQEFFYVVGEILNNNRVPYKIEFLSDYKEILMDRVPKFEKILKKIDD